MYMILKVRKTHKVGWFSRYTYRCIKQTKRPRDISHWLSASNNRDHVKETKRQGSRTGRRRCRSPDPVYRKTSVTRPSTRRNNTHKARQGSGGSDSDMTQQYIPPCRAPINAPGTSTTSPSQSSSPSSPPWPGMYDTVVYLHVHHTSHSTPRQTPPSASSFATSHRTSAAPSRPCRSKTQSTLGGVAPTAPATQASSLPVQGSDPGTTLS